MRALLLLCAVVCSACAPTQCKRTQILISNHPQKPKPAGYVTVGCDGKVLVEITADAVEY